MRGLAYGGVADWVGIDTDPESPDAIHADSRLVMRAIGLHRFNLFDLDAFGSPWEWVWIVSQRRRPEKGERVALAITNGHAGAVAARTKAQVSRQLIDAGITPGNANKWVSGKRGAELYAQRLVAAWFDGCVIRRWLTAAANGGAWYFGVILEGL